MYECYDLNYGIKDIGVDMCDIRRFEKMRNDIREKFARKILTDEELEEYAASTDKSKTLAVFFCAKEAISKALGTGFRSIYFQDIMIKRNEAGKPIVFISEKASLIIKQKDVKSIKISITHEKEYVVAFAASN